MTVSLDSRLSSASGEGRQRL
ncbi:hypothetical protein, partial [Kluyvera sichuanensis]